MLSRLFFIALNVLLGFFYFHISLYHFFSTSHILIFDDINFFNNLADIYQIEAAPHYFSLKNLHELFYFCLNYLCLFLF